MLNKTILRRKTVGVVYFDQLLGRLPEGVPRNCIISQKGSNGDGKLNFFGRDLFNKIEIQCLITPLIWPGSNVSFFAALYDNFLGKNTF